MRAAAAFDGSGGAPDASVQDATADAGGVEGWLSARDSVEEGSMLRLGALETRAEEERGAVTHRTLCAGQPNFP